jgi:hypothetical protein
LALEGPITISEQHADVVVGGIGHD